MAQIPNIELRRRILQKGLETKSGHFASALSCVDCIKYLYDHVLRDGIDTFILSKAHGEMAQFSVLETKGFKPEWTVHLDLNEAQGIYATTGSLGHGLPIGVGRAFAKKLKGEDGRVYVLVGDGETEEGSNWEALIIANNLGLDNFTLLADWNKYQAVSSVYDVARTDRSTLKKRLEAFGCSTIVVDGHDDTELARIGDLPRGLNAVILDTVKGKGISFLENTHAHGYSWSAADVKQAWEELK